jgi:hypothetical protein
MDIQEMVKCTSCLQEGHAKNSKKCPNFASYVKPVKRVKSTVDDITEDWLKRRFASVRRYTQETIELSSEVGGLIRLANIPEDLTENIVKFIIRNKLGDSSCVWCKGVGRSGDLHSDVEEFQEVKSFTSDGPCSFGPKKKFTVLYFLDLRKWLEDEISLFKVGLNNDSPIWKALKMNKAETFEMMAEDGKRPHIPWESIRSQMPGDVCVEVYRGTFEGIFTLPAVAEAV